MNKEKYKKMLSQEESFRFFQKMSESLYKDGYPILNNLKTEFPNLLWEEEIVVKRREEEVNTSDEENEMTEDS